jgi:hypothetical protein
MGERNLPIKRYSLQHILFARGVQNDLDHRIIMAEGLFEFRIGLQQFILPREDGLRGKVELHPGGSPGGNDR